MIRLLSSLALLAVAAFGFSWLADHPGGLALTFGNLRVDTSLPVALAGLVALFVVLWLIVALVRLALGAPQMLSSAGRARRQEKGRRALSRGMIAAAAGDLRAADRASAEASRRLGSDPLALLLEAQYAQLSGDRESAARAFARMAERADTRLLGLRGLYAEAFRKGDAQAAHDYAARAHAIAPLPWAAQAVLDHHTSRQDWAAALAIVDANTAQKTIDRRLADRQRAVLLTAAAIDLGERDPDQVLRFTQEALRLAPGLTPAAVLAASTLTRRQEIRKAAKTIEAAWRIMPHPDLARAYLGVRLGDSATDRLARAETLLRMDRDHPEGRMAVARAALEAREFLKARRAMAPLIEDGRPTCRMCLLMADIEEAEHGSAGSVREWLARATRAPRDPAWVADGFVSDVWSPLSPATGRLDAFVWKTPEERLSAPEAPPPPVLPPVLPAALPPDLPAVLPAGGGRVEAPEIEQAKHFEAIAAPQGFGEDVPRSADRATDRARDRAATEAPQTGVRDESFRAQSNAGRPDQAASVLTTRPVFFPHPQAPDDPGPESIPPERPLEDRRLA